MTRIRTLLLAAPLALATIAGHADANDTTFTYQGVLRDGGAPANGAHSLTFRLYSAAIGGTPLGTINAGSVDVTDGVFSVDLDFGAGDFNNSDRWLEIVVNGTSLSPRQPITRSPYSIQTRGIYVDDNGHVGLGGTLTTTGELLTLRDPDASILMLSQGNDFGPHITFRNTASGLATTHGQIRFDDGAQLASIGYVKPLGSPAGLAIGHDLLTDLKITDTGLVGIGDELNPATTLHVQSEDLGLSSAHFDHDDIVAESTDAVIGIYSSDGGSRGSALVLGEVTGGVLADKWAVGRNTTGAGSVMTFKYGPDKNWAVNPSFFNIETNGQVSVSPGGSLGVGTTNPQATLDVEGNARVHVLEIVGADLAEKFPTSDSTEAEPGMVLEIDPENPGLLRIASSSYSRLVAGVVSGANGLPAGTIMGNLPGMEEATPIALSGRVWVLCDASDAPIRAGDFLTTSDTPGHAMCADDQARSAGAVIGKAMTDLDQGQTGMVLVLVSLQ